MTSEQWVRAKELFQAALEQPAEARASFLGAACNGDAEVRAEVENLLAGHAQAGSFLEKPAIGISAETPTFTANELISGRFRVIRFLGRGGMGEVYEAKDLELDEHVALKTIRQDISSDPHAVLRFKQEIQLARRVTHPNVCRIFDFERHVRPSANAGDDPSSSAITFLTMELLEGETLAQRLRRTGRMTSAEALPLVKQMAEALAAAHDAGIIHRDFKPSNVILVATGVSDSSPAGCRAVVMDFGLARAAAAAKPASTSAESFAQSLTATGRVLGTLAYMAPEQLEGGEVSPATDIYALGLVMYEMVTGVPAFPDDLPFVGIFKRVKEPPVSPRVHLPSLDPAWESTILGCLEIMPAQRFQSAGAVVAALQGRSGSAHLRSGSTLVPQAGLKTREGQSPILGYQSVGWPLRKLVITASVAGAVLLALLALFLRFSPTGASWEPSWLRPVPTVSEGDSILVADFENMSGEKFFDRTVSDLVGRALEESHYANVVPRQAALEALQRMGRPNADSIDAIAGREVCIRENYRALLTGQIAKQPPGYRIDVKLMDPRKGAVVVAESQTLASGNELYDAVDQLIARVRGDMGESFDRIAKGQALPHVTTPSLAALNRYNLAVDKYQARDYNAALTFAQSAVDLDHDFAMAHLLLARIYDERGLAQRTYQELALARRGLNTVSEREQHLILATDYYAHHNAEKAAEEYNIVIELAPDDLDALRGLAANLSWTNQISNSVAIQQRVLELSPNDISAYSQLMGILLRQSRFQEVLETYKRARLRKLASSYMHYYAALASWGLDDTTTARHEFELLGQSSDVYFENFARTYLASMLVYEGRLAAADQMLRTGPLAGAERTGGLAFARYSLLGRINLVQGKRTLAKANAKRAAEALFEGAPPLLLQEAGLLAVDAGDIELGADLLGRLRRLTGTSVGEFMQSAYNDLQGATEFAAGNLEGAIESQRRSAVFALAFQPQARLGQAYQAKHDWPSAIEAYTKYLTFKGFILDSVSPSDWILAHLELARLYARTGDTSQSMRYYDEFLHLWGQADNDLEQVRQARAERVAVASRRARP